MLVEGTTDLAVINACAERQGLHLGAETIVCVAVNGRDNMMLCHAVLSALHVRCHAVFDADKGNGGSGEEGQGQQQPLRLSGSTPHSVAGHRLPADAHRFAQHMEAHLDEYWPAWGERRRELVRSEPWRENKHVVTYAEAARTAAAEPPDLIHALLENVRRLTRV